MDTTTPVKLFGAGAITLATFGLGPLLGFAARELPLPEQEIVVMSPPRIVLALESPEVGEDEVPEPAEAIPAPEAPPSPAAVPPRPAPPPAASAPPSPAAEVAAAEVGDPAPRVASKAGRCEVTTENPAIRRDGRGVFQVDAELVRYYTSHLGALNRLGWSASHDGPDGKADGMQIGGVRCGSDLHLAGIRSGDVVHEVNGRRVRSIAEALWVYRAVRNDRIIEVELTRRGRRQTLVYTLT